MSRYFVVYDIPSTKSVALKAGPYSSDEVQYQVDDISGYEGVENVRVISEEEVQDIAAEGETIVDRIGFTD